MSDLTPVQRMTELLDELAGYANQTLVIKIGGNSIAEDPLFLPLLAEQVAFLHRLGLRFILVHGAGPQIDAALAAAGHSREKGADGRRLTTPAMMEVVGRAMERLNDHIAHILESQGCSVFQGTGPARSLVRVRPLTPRGPDEDRTGLPISVETAPLKEALNAGHIVLLPSQGENESGLAYNTNADDYAMAMAQAFKARRLVMATNVRGVLDGEKNLLSTLSPAQAQHLMETGIITGGMIPKVESALAALQAGVEAVAIINAHERGSLLAELLTHAGSGTLISADS